MPRSLLGMTSPAAFSAHDDYIVSDRPLSPTTPQSPTPSEYPYVFSLQTELSACLANTYTANRIGIRRATLAHDAALAANAAKLEEAYKTIDTLKSEKQGVENQLKTLLEDGKALLSGNQATPAALNGLREASDPLLDSLRVDKRCMEDQLQTTYETEDMLKSNQLLEEHLRTAHETIDRLQSEKEDLEAQIAAAHEDSEWLLEDYDSLFLEKKDMEEELRTANTTATWVKHDTKKAMQAVQEQHDAESLGHMREVQTLRDEIESLLSEKQDWKRKLQALRGDRDWLMFENEEALRVAQQKYDVIQAEKQDLIQALQAATPIQTTELGQGVQDAPSGHDRKVEMLKAEVHRRKAELTRLEREQISLLSAAHDELLDLVSDLDSKLASARDEKAELATKLLNVQDELDHLQHKYRKLEGGYDDLHEAYGEVFHLREVVEGYEAKFANSSSFLSTGSTVAGGKRNLEPDCGEDVTSGKRARIH